MSAGLLAAIALSCASCSRLWPPTATRSSPSARSTHFRACPTTPRSSTCWSLLSWKCFLSCRNLPRNVFMLFLSLIFRLLLHSLLSLLSLLIIVGLSLIWHRLIAAWHPLSQSAPSILCVRLFRVILVLCWWLNARWLLLLLLERRDLPRGVHARRPAAARLALAAVPVCVCAVSCRAVGGSGWLGGCWCACSTWWWALVLNAVACSTWWRSQRGGVLNAMTCSTRLPSSSSTSRCAHGHPQRQPPAVCTPPPTPATRNGRQLHRADAAVQHGGLIGGQCCVDLRIPTPGEWKRLVVAVLVAQPEQPLK